MSNPATEPTTPPTMAPTFGPSADGRANGPGKGDEEAAAVGTSKNEEDTTVPVAKGSAVVDISLVQ